MQNNTVHTHEKSERRSPRFKVPSLKTAREFFDVGGVVAISVLGLAASIIILAIFFFIQSAPSTTITISSGPEGSIFHRNALRYSKILQENGVKVNVLTSKGSFENLQRLGDQNSKVDIGIVQAGISGPNMEALSSLGSISYQPILIFYRGPLMRFLSELKTKKVAIGQEGSGTYKIALDLLAANGIAPSDSGLLFKLEASEAATALLNRKLDAAFIMGEAASSDLLRKLLRSKEVHLFNFKQAHAYSRKIDYLNVLELPEGVLDLGLNIPSQSISLLGPMVELIAVKNLNPALSDLMLEAATQVHNRPGLFQKRGEFPAPVRHSIRMSEDAARYYKSGKSLLYRYLPFWLASLALRIIVVLLPTLVLLFPVLRSVPAIFRWRIQYKIHQRYRELLNLEKDYVRETDRIKQEEIRRNFDRIEEAVNKMKLPASFVDQLYGLRGHIDYVRHVISKK